MPRTRPVTNAAAVEEEDVDVQDTPAIHTSFQAFTVNIGGAKAKIRHDTLEGRPYMVVPAVILTEGVHNGSQGPLYYPPSELGKTPVVWNYKPIVMYHPTMNGKAISACEKEVLESRKVGVMMNTRFSEGKLKTEAWIEKDRLEKASKEVLNRLEKGKMVEVSTGLFTDNEETEGDWHGEKYTAIARNFRPDHLAILPDQRGSCSIADGAGLLRNGQSHNELYQKIGDILRTKCKDTDSKSDPISCYVYPQDVYDTYFIYQRKGKMFLQKYEVEKQGKVLFVGLPTEVTREIRYKDSSGNIVGNSRKDHAMDKEKVVDAIISNAASGWTEDERDWLMDQDEEKVQKIADNAAAKTDGDEETDEEGNVVNPKATAKNTPDNIKKGGKGKMAADAEADGEQDYEENCSSKKMAKNAEQDKEEPMTAEEYIANAPDGIREVLECGVASLNAEKSRLIGLITANKANRFTKEALASKSLSDLNAIASLATNGAPKRSARFDGNGQEAPAVNMENIEVLDLPTMNFEQKKVA